MEDVLGQDGEVGDATCDERTLASLLELGVGGARRERGERLCERERLRRVRGMDRRQEQVEKRALGGADTVGAERQRDAGGQQRP